MDFYLRKGLQQMFQQMLYFCSKTRNMVIRIIEPQDSFAIAVIIKKVLLEHDAPKTGTAYADTSLEDMYMTYRKPGCAYFVLEDKDILVGGAGIAPLQEGEEGFCELQKMYFAPEARGRGYGRKMIELCLAEAGKKGYTYCYLETMPSMKAAQKLYKEAGFEYLEQPMGCTGHTSCTVWMLKKI